MLPHMSDQHYGWWSRPGGGLYVLQGFKSNRPRVRCLTGRFPAGSFLGPDLSYDGRKVLFAYCRHYPQVAGLEKVDKEKLPADAFYKVYEMNLDGTGRRQLTQGRYDDFDPRYLPNGDIVFLSTRKGAAIQCSLQNSESTRHGTPARQLTFAAAATTCAPAQCSPSTPWMPGGGSSGRFRRSRILNGHRPSPMMVASCTRGGITSIGSTAISKACGQPTRTARIRSWFMAITPLNRRRCLRRAPSPAPRNWSSPRRRTIPSPGDPSVCWTAREAWKRRRR